MGDKIFLQEMSATVAFCDVRRFAIMSAQLGPVEISLALRRYYEHVEEAVLRHEGRVVKFISDGVLAFFPSLADKDHATNALNTLRDLTSVVGAWLAENEKLGLPVMEYSVGVATGTVLFGELGTARQRAFDLLGLPAILAIKLARLATTRSVPHLVTGVTIQAQREPSPSIEVEEAELVGQRVRLYRLLTRRETIVMSTVRAEEQD